MPAFIHLGRAAAALAILLLGLAGVAPDSQAWEGHKRAPWVGTMLNGTKCDGGQVAFGPYDYLQRNSLQAQLEVVEESHFNEDVESLRKGLSATAMGDIHYTLQAWPNHHRALNSAFRFRLQNRESWGQGDNTAQNYPAECYLQRAMNFSPNDPIPYMLHGMLMHQMKQFDTALKSYRQAVRLRPEDLITQYNMGLTLVELKNFAEAQKVADKVYAADFPLPGLQRKLAAAKRQNANPPVAQAKSAAPAATVANTAEPAASEPKDSKSREMESPAKSAPSTHSASHVAPNSTELPSSEPVTEQKPVLDAAAGESEEPSVEQTTPAKQEAASSPQLTPEQLAILRQALKDQAAKKSLPTDEPAP